jgi:protein-tyrosine phosphatase
MHPADQSTAQPIANLRDVGGHEVRGGGHVRRGLVYRSAAVGGGEAVDGVLTGLGVRTVVDLRTREERDSHPDRLPAGIDLVVADVLQGAAPEGSPAEIRAVLGDPAAAARLLGDGRAERYFTAKYWEFVTLDSARTAYGRLFAGLASAPGRPVLFHCGTGKDRTGWAAAALLLLLDVQYEAVVADYLRSAAEVRPTMEAGLAEFRARGGDPELLEPIIDARVAYLETALSAMRASFRSIEGYFADGLGIDATAQRSLREALVEPA